MIYNATRLFTYVTVMAPPACFNVVVHGASMLQLSVLHRCSSQCFTVAALSSMSLQLSVLCRCSSQFYVVAAISGSMLQLSVNEDQNGLLEKLTKSVYDLKNKNRLITELSACVAAGALL